MEEHPQILYLPDFSDILQPLPFVALCWSNRNLKSNDLIFSNAKFTFHTCNVIFSKHFSMLEHDKVEYILTVIWFEAAKTNCLNWLEFLPNFSYGAALGLECLNVKLSKRQAVCNSLSLKIIKKKKKEPNQRISAFMLWEISIS